MMKLISPLKNLSIFDISRFIFLSGVLLRFFITTSTYNQFITTGWLIVLPLSLIYTTFIIVVVIIHPGAKDTLAWHRFQIYFDTFLFSVINFLTLNPKTDLFLLFFLPLIISAVYFNKRQVIHYFSVIICIYFLTNYFIGLFSGYPELLGFLRDYLPRVTFFIVVFLVVWFKVEEYKDQTNQLEKINKTVLEINDGEFQDRLEKSLSSIVKIIEAKGGVFYLLSDYPKFILIGAISGLRNFSFSAGDIIDGKKTLVGKITSEDDFIVIEDTNHSSYFLNKFEKQSRSIVFLPLASSSKIIGVLSLYFDELPANVFTKKLSLIKRLKPNITLTIKDIILMKKTETQRMALQILDNCAEIMNENLEKVNILSNAVKFAWELAKIYTVKTPIFSSIGLLHFEKKIEFVSTFPEKYSELINKKIGTIDLNNAPYGIVGRAAIQKSTQVVLDVIDDPDYILINKTTKSQISVPIKYGDNLYGILNIEHEDPYAFPVEFRENIEVFASQIAASLNNYFLLQKTNLQRDRTDCLNKALISINQKNTIEDLADAILEQLNNLIPHNRSTLQVINDDQRSIIGKRNLPSKFIDNNLLKPVSQDKLISQILQNKTPCFITDPYSHPLWNTFPTTIDIKTWIGIPLLSGDKVIGLITVDQFTRTLYLQDDKDIIEVYTRFAGSILQNSLMLQTNANQIIELDRTTKYLETMIDYFNDYQNLAMIGLVYGEDIHYAQNKLGMAKTKADNINQGYYDDNLDELKIHSKEIIQLINDYLQTLENTRHKAITELYLSPLDLNKLIDRVLDNKKVTLKVTVEKYYNIKNPIIVAPDRQLGQIFYVLIQNALDAMSSGNGLLQIKTDFLLDTNNQIIRVSIIDNGKGIPVDKQEKLFVPKGTGSLSSNHYGTGMGLVWAHSFIRTFEGGNLSYNTVIDKGTSMLLDIPIEFKRSSFTK